MNFQLEKGFSFVVPKLNYPSPRYIIAKLPSYLKAVHLVLEKE